MFLAQHFNNEICHRPGKSMIQVDASSKSPLTSGSIVRKNDKAVLTRTY